MKTPKQNRSVKITDEQIRQWAYNIRCAIGGGFGPESPALEKLDVLGPVADNADNAALIPATPTEVATLAALLAQQSKGKLVPAQCVPEAIDLVTFAAGVMAYANPRLCMAMGTKERPPCLTLTEAMRITGLKERALRDHVKRLCPKACDRPGWKLLRTHAVLSPKLVMQIRGDVLKAKKVRAKAGWRGQKKSLDRTLRKYAAG